MKNLPALTAKQIIRALKRAGFREDRQIEKDAGLTIEEFLRLL